MPASAVHQLCSVATSGGILTLDVKNSRAAPAHESSGVSKLFLQMVRAFFVNYINII
jgi:hypothetical protein